MYEGKLFFQHKRHINFDVLIFYENTHVIRQHDEELLLTDKHKLVNFQFYLISTHGS